MTRYVIDTNVLIDNPSICNQLDGEVIIPFIVIQELDHLKGKVYGAREALRQIEKCENIIIDRTYEVETNDDKILDIAVANNATLLTNDFGLKDKAKAIGHSYESVNDEAIKYKGYKEVTLNDSELGYFYENLDKNIYDLYVNQYLIIKNVNNEIIDTYVWRNECHQELKLPKIKGLKHRNVLQACALDLLHNDNIKVKIVAGNFGSGKSYLSMKVALYHVLEKGMQSKIMVVRNAVGSGEPIGFLKGTKDDKTKDFFKSVIQHLDGGEQEAEILESRGQLLKEIPFYMKGLSIEDTFIVCDEAEDLNVKTLKLIGTRLSGNSCIAFAGDYEQAEPEYMKNNGLLNAINKLKGDPLVGIIVLDEDVRSSVSKVFTKL